MTANQRGSLFMVAAMAGFAVEDMFIKSAAKAMPLGQVLALMGALGILWFALQSRRVGEPAFPTALRCLARGFALSTAVSAGTLHTRCCFDRIGITEERCNPFNPEQVRLGTLFQLRSPTDNVR